MFTRQAQTLFCARPDYIQINFRKSNTHNIFVNQIWTLWGGGLKCDSNLISTDASQSGCSDYTDQISVRHLNCFLLIDADVSHRLSNVPGNSETDRSSSKVSTITCRHQSLLCRWHHILHCTLKPVVTAAQKINTCTSWAGWHGKNIMSGFSHDRITISILSRVFGFSCWFRIFYKLR